MASEQELTALRQCEKPGCEQKITNGLKDVKDILLAMSNHLAAVHPKSGGSEGGGGAKSNAAIPMLKEGLSEIAWSASQPRFDPWALACKLSDRNIENSVFECIPNELADQIVVDLEGNEDKETLLGKIKAAVVKKRSVFLYLQIMLRI